MNESMITVNRTTPDYTCDRYWAKILAERLQNYYHSRGMKTVHVWTEPLHSDSTRKIWTIKSNLKFKIPVDPK